MKKIFPYSAFLLLLLSVFSLSSFAQKDDKDDKDDKEIPYLVKQDPATKAYLYEEVIQVDSNAITQEKAYGNAKQFIVSNLKTVDNNIIADDKDFTQIINTGNLLTKPDRANATSIEFKLKVFFKHGRYKIMVDNIVFSGYTADGYGNKFPFVFPYSKLADRNTKWDRRQMKGINNALTPFIAGLKNAVIGVAPASGAGGNW